MMIPMDATERGLTIDWFVEAMNRHSVTVFDADDMLAQLRLAGDVVNLERLSRALACRGLPARDLTVRGPAIPPQYSFE